MWTEFGSCEIWGLDWGMIFLCSSSLHRTTAWSEQQTGSSVTLRSWTSPWRQSLQPWGTPRLMWQIAGMDQPVSHLPALYICLNIVLFYWSICIDELYTDVIQVTLVIKITNRKHFKWYVGLCVDRIPTGGHDQPHGHLYHGRTLRVPHQKTPRWTLGHLQWWKSSTVRASTQRSGLSVHVREVIAEH